jgi:SNF2 family DNA or RNA helicase
MGLGKTVQIIAFLCTLWERYSIAGPHLVVMPMSILSVWQNDMEKFCPDVDLHIHHGNKIDRHANFALWTKNLNSKRQKIAKLRADSSHADYKKPQHISIVLTTYDLAIKDLNLLKKKTHKWGYLVVDEAHRIKNSASKLFECLKLVGARRQVGFYVVL